MTYFQAKATLNGVAYEGDCHSGEAFAIRALVTVVAEAKGVTFLEAVDLLRGKVNVEVV